MNILRCLIIFLFILISAHLGIAQEDDLPWKAGPVKVVKNHMVCGDAEVFFETTILSFYGPNFPLPPQYSKQTIRFVNNKRGIDKMLPHDGKIFTLNKDYVIEGKRIKVLDATVTYCGCSKAKSKANYLLFGYNCTDESECYGLGSNNREWRKIISMEGKDLTRGYPRHGQNQRVEKLEKRLGIGEKIQGSLEIK